MSTLFPTWPHILFAVLEPLSLLAGFFGALLDTSNFISGQTSHAGNPPSHPSVLALTYQLGNLYLLLAILGVFTVYTASEPRVLRNYLIALAIGDVGHIYATYVAMGASGFRDVATWSPVAWGNIAVTGFLLVNRIAYLLGVFGYPLNPRQKEGGPKVE